MDWPTAAVLVAAIVAQPVTLWLLTRQRDEAPIVGASAVGYQTYSEWPYDDADDVPFGFAGYGRG